MTIRVTVKCANNVADLARMLTAIFFIAFYSTGEFPVEERTNDGIAERPANYPDNSDPPFTAHKVFT